MDDDDVDPGRVTLMNEAGEVPMAVDKIQFSLMSPEQMQQVACLTCTTEELYTVRNGFQPVPNGVLDLRLGTSNKDRVCQTCGEKLKTCTGHFGNVQLCLPVFHTGYFKQILSILQSICKRCSRILLPPDERSRFITAMRGGMADHFQMKALVKQVLERCKKVNCCPWCQAKNGTVKKIGYLTIVHERHKAKAGPDPEFVETFTNAIAANEELKAVLHKAHDDLHPLRARQLFVRISDEDCELLDMHPDYGRPEQLIWTCLPVPPACIRPSVGIDASNSNEDDLTMWMMKIIECSKQLQQSLDKGTWKFDHIMHIWMHHPYSLQVLCAQYINGDQASMPQAMKSMQSIRGLCQRMKGKQGRFRAHLQGKRVDFTSRTVISPDPNLRIDQVGIPQQVARILTFPEPVYDRNIERIRQLIRNGPYVFPGANAIEFADGPKRTYETHGRQVECVGRFDLRHGDRNAVADKLRAGDVVERHLNDGDIVLFNRQPSLHRLSIMAHYVKVLQWRTFRFNECVCGPYNADFDGDEMNVHAPQTIEACTEALELMGVKNNLITPRNGEPLIAATQDFITASYLMTRKDVFIDRAQFCQFCAYLSDGQEDFEIPMPTVVKPIELWTGKQLFTMLLRSAHGVMINLQTKERGYSGYSEKGYSWTEHMCPSDGWVCLEESYLICGQLGKKTLGDGNKKGLIYTVFSNFGSLEAAKVMHRLSKLTSRWLSNYGFTIGLEDVQPSLILIETKDRTVRHGYQECQRHIKTFKEGKLEVTPGSSPEESLEEVLQNELNKVRNTCGDVCFDSLPPMNKTVVMAQAGSKGSNLNISQMVAALGQQVISGSRVPDGFTKRSLPHFPINSKEPEAKGFVANSFYTGLTATEFFFHTMGGREGLVDTAVKTADTGYLQRRMVKTLEDVSIEYDGTVRDSKKNIVQFSYGGDGLDPILMESDESTPLDFECDLRGARCKHPYRAETSTVLLPWQVVACAQGRLFPTLPGSADAADLGRQEPPPPRGTPQLTVAERAAGLAQLDASMLTATSAYFLSVVRFVEKEADAIAQLREELGLEPQREVPAGTSDAMAAVAGGDSPPRSPGRTSRKRASPASSSSPSSKSRRQRGKATATVAATTAEIEETANRLRCVTRAVLDTFLGRCVRKYERCVMEPGTAVGAIVAQSIGEPATQMTLKTFHFAGVASMNVTMGVPRIKELMDATKAVKTPIITAELEVKAQTSELSARYIRARIEKTALGEVCKSIAEVYDTTTCYIQIKLDLKSIKNLNLEQELNCEIVRQALMKESKLKLKKAKLIQHNGKDTLRVWPPDDSRDKLFYGMQRLKNALPKVVVCGIKSVVRAVVVKQTKADKGLRGKWNLAVPRYYLAIEGRDLAHIKAVSGVSVSQS
jgi:DNA-directed RNA polymerase III subunit RPC1